MAGYLPNKDTALLNWANNFVSVAGANLASLGLTAAEVNNLNGFVGDFGTALTAVATAKAQYEGRIAGRNGDKRDMVSAARTLVKRVQASPDVPASLKVQLGIAAGDTPPNHAPPVTPASLLATPNADGTNLLTWHKMGNKATTQFVVLAKPVTLSADALTDTGWTIVGATTRSRFAHTGVVPGAAMAYKVQAARAGQSSIPTSPVTVYTG